MFGFHNCSEDKKPSLAFDTVWDSPLNNPSYNTGHCCPVETAVSSRFHSHSDNITMLRDVAKEV